MLDAECLRTATGKNHLMTTLVKSASVARFWQSKNALANFDARKFTLKEKNRYPSATRLRQFVDI